MDPFTIIITIIKPRLLLLVMVMKKKLFPKLINNLTRLNKFVRISDLNLHRFLPFFPPFSPYL